jgi:radical SAM superfamily enzyme YgiQ (UPF0313 family)
MRILLVLPALEHLRVTKERPEPARRAMLRFSVLSLTTVAALTPPEHEVLLCDENVQALDFDADVDVVGVSFMTALAPRAYEIAREFRARGKATVAGGYHATLNPMDAAEHFDAVVVGDAEGTWPRVLEDVKSGSLRRVYRPESLCDLSQAPIPRRDLTEKTARHYVTTNAVQTGRGCGHGCKYCSITAFHRRTHRNRPLEHVLEELRPVPRNFMFMDDNIIADPEYARELFRAMAPMKKRWVSQCSLKIADDPELLTLARKAGCRGLFIGVETISRRNLDSVGKGFNESSRHFERIAAIRKQGIGVIAGMIVGMDNDDKRTFERTLDFLKRARIDALQLNILTPLPGTPLYDEMEHHRRVTDRNWSHYDFRHVVIEPALMSARDLQDGADWLYRQFYRLDRVLGRFVRSAFSIGFIPAFLNLRLGLTYRYDHRLMGVVGRNPAEAKAPGRSGGSMTRSRMWRGLSSPRLTFGLRPNPRVR